MKEKPDSGAPSPSAELSTEQEMVSSGVREPIQPQVPAEESLESPACPDRPKQRLVPLPQHLSSSVLAWFTPDRGHGWKKAAPTPAKVTSLLLETITWYPGRQVGLAVIFLAVLK